MTEYYIHGGLALENSERNKNFFRTFLREYKEENNILFIPFAKDDYSVAFDLFKESIYSYTGREYSLELAIENQEHLLSQIKNSEYVYIHGGDYRKLYNKLKFLIEYKDIFKGKKVIVSSAGTNLLAKFSYANDHNKIQQGLGFLDILTFCHYKGKSDGKELLVDLHTYLPIYTLEEGEFVEIDID